MAFPGYKDQSALSFLKGRSSRFLHFYAVCSIMSRQEIFLYLTSVWLRFVFIRFYKASVFSNIFGYYCEHCLFVVKIFSLFLVIPRAVCVLRIVILVSCLFNLGVLGPWEFFWQAGSCAFCAYVAPLCGVPGRYNFIQALCWNGWRGCTHFFVSLALL